MSYIKVSFKDFIFYENSICDIQTITNSSTTMMRNSRSLEVMMENSLKIKINEEMICGIEHHMNKQFTDALCTMLNHPRKCPHDHEIPIGECCQK